jgi:hypothetical protein
MKKFLSLFIGLLIFTLAFSQGYNDPIMKSEYRVYGFPDTWRMIPIRHEGSGKFGFTRNATFPTILIEPVFDGIGIVDTKSRFLPVMKNGKWGVMDMAGHAKEQQEQPFVPCKYDKVEVFGKGGQEYIIATSRGRRERFNAPKIKD